MPPAVMLTAPALASGPLGVKLRVTVQEAPAASDAGQPLLVDAKGPMTMSPPTVMAAPLPFVKVTVQAPQVAVCVELATPITPLPKDSPVGGPSSTVEREPARSP